jgi:iron complex outermembrane receptor protein
MLRRIFIGVIYFGFLIAFSTHISHAQDTTATLRSDPVVVTATRIEQSSFDLPVSIDSLDIDKIHDQQQRVNISESLVRVPGVVAQNRQNYAQDLQISSRGFGARSTFGIRGVRVLTDGIPATMPDGQGQAATIDLESARRIEVLRGPFSAIYGNASGGVIQVFSEEGSATPALEAGLFAGTYGTERASVKFGGQNSSLNYIGSLSRFESDGYREHSAVTRETGSTRLRWSADADTTVTFLVNALHQGDTQDPLGLTRVKMEEDPRQAGTGALQFNTRKSIAHLQGGLTLEQRLGSNDRFTLIGYSGQRDVTQYLAFAGSGPTQSGGIIDLDRGFTGLGIRWTHQSQLSDMPYTITMGVDYDNMYERRRGFVNNNGIAGELKRDEDDRVFDFDQYVQFEWQFAPRWRVSTGLRHNRVAFDSKDYYITDPSNPDDSGAITFEKTNPMLGVLYQWSDSVNLYANAGQGFETPTFAELAYRPDGSPGLNFSLRPSVSRSSEAGIKAFITPMARVNAALFRIRAYDEIVTGPSPAPGRNTFTNANLTTRDGFELSVDNDLGNGVNVYFAYSYIDASFADYVNFSGTNLSGKRIPGVPRTTLYGEINWRPLTGLVTALEARRVSSIAVNDDNDDAAEAYTVANWRIGLEQKGSGWRLQEFLRIDNLFDKIYIGSVIVNANGGAYFEPAPRRNYSIGLNARFEF